MGIGVFSFHGEVTPLSPAPAVGGRSLFAEETPKYPSLGNTSQEQPLRPNTDSTGLSITPEALERARENFEKEQAALVHERAYQEAGKKAQSHNAAFGQTHRRGDTSHSEIVTGAVAAGTSSQRSQELPAVGAEINGQPAAKASEADNPSAEQAAENLQNGGVESRSPERTFIGSAAGASEGKAHAGTGEAQKRGGEEAEDEDENASSTTSLSEEEELEVQELKDRDREVRAHEQAHISAGGSIVAGGPSYETTTGPDGKSYAVGGEVQIDTSKGSTPEETIAKAQQVRSAALAPAQPSAQDQKVAATAAKLEAEARQEMRTSASEETSDESENADAQAASENDPSTAAGANTGQEGEQSPAVEVTRQERLAASAAGAYRRASGSLPPAPYGSVFSFAV